jgi:Putative mucin or carbohydrate-binding module/Peptidase M60, enhancin and enhancin-like
MATISQSKKITVLPRPTWLDAAGMSKGIDHDRQHLGIILAAGQVIKARQTNAAFTGNVTLRLLNDDSKTEGSKEVGSGWVELSVNAVAVPFIDTPYNSVAPVVEYQYPGTSKSLPVYRKGENESAFFSGWESQKAEFALIEANYVIILVPVISRDALKKLPEVKNIDGLIGYYESVFTFFNALTGVSFEPQRPTDLNCRNRYFIKADKNGAGAAYYSNIWTAETSNSISSFWLTPVATNWGSLHEIGHGYQGTFMADRYFSTGESWNNIYAASYQSVMLGDRKYQEGWLYDYGHQAHVENIITNYIVTGKALNDWDLRSKLYFQVMMIEAAGWNAFTHFNQQYRLDSNTPGFVAGDHALLDMLSETYASVGRQVDVTPFVQLVGGYITPAQRERNLYSQAKVVYPLNQLVQGDKLATLQQQLKLQSALSLVDVQQLQASGLKGDVTLQLKIDDFSQIYGETITLLDGARYVRQLLIESRGLILRELPIGVYALRLPTGRNYKYQPQLAYLVVKPGAIQQQVEFVRKTTSPLASQEIALLGLGDNVFGTVLVDQVNRVLKVDVTDTNPHAYFPNVTYAEVVIRNKAGAELFRKTIPGTNATISHNEVGFEVGFKLEIFHKEPSRVRLIPAFAGVIDPKANTNVFEITASGLKQVVLQNDPQKALLARIESAVAALRSNYTMLHAECTAKVDIFLAINLFPSPQREALLKQYADCIPANNNPPGEGLGNAFTFAFTGIGDWRFLTAELDLVSKLLTVNLAAGIAHHYFTDTYAALRYLDANGKELLNLDIKGNVVQQASKWLLPISGYGGEMLHIRHAEPSRLIITNDMQNVRLAIRDKLQSYRITPTGLEYIA